MADAQIAAEISDPHREAESSDDDRTSDEGIKAGDERCIERACFPVRALDEEIAILRTQALETTPEQKEVREIENAMKVCKDSIRSACSMIGERAQMHQRHDGSWE